jgi:DNA-binding beta-propeller fold protein YncE
MHPFVAAAAGLGLVAALSASATAVELTPVSEILTQTPGAVADFAHAPDENAVYVLDGPKQAVTRYKLEPGGLVKSAAWPLTGKGTAIATAPGRVLVTEGGEGPATAGRLVAFTPQGEMLGSVPVGIDPADIAVSPDGQMAVIANAGTRLPDGTDPEGSISLVDLDAMTGTEIGFGDVDPENFDISIHRAAPEGTGWSEALEPRSVIFSPDGATVLAVMPANNAAVIIDTMTGDSSAPFGLGFQDFSGFPADLSDKDDRIRLTNWPVRSMRQPLAAAALSYRGQSYFVTANTGMPRTGEVYDETVRAGTLQIDPVIFPDPDALLSEERLGRLVVSAERGDQDGDGDNDTLYAFGGRSFSILASAGTMTFDSGARIERHLAAAEPERFNADAAGTMDAASPELGSAPSAIAVLERFGHRYVFVGLRDIAGIAVFDVIHPRFARWAGFIPLNESGETRHAGVQKLEVAIVPDGAGGATQYLLAAFERSGSLVLYQID